MMVREVEEDGCGAGDTDLHHQDDGCAVGYTDLHKHEDGWTIDLGDTAPPGRWGCCRRY